MLVAVPALTQQDQPRVLERTAPEYTDQARLARLEGSSLVSLVIGDDATLHDVHVTRPIGLGLDEKAVEAVKNWQFAPAVQGEKPVQAMARVEVNFRLLIRREDWHLTRAEFETPNGAAQPVIISAPYPEQEKSSASATVNVSFDVDEQGLPANIRVTEASDQKSAKEVTQFLPDWRFQPAMAGPRGVVSHGVLRFRAGADAVSE